MSFQIPQVADFKAQPDIALAFPFGEGSAAVSDAQIQQALNQAAAGSIFPANLFSTTPLGPTGANPQTSEAMMAFNYLAAHFLWKSIQSRGGLRAPGYKGGATSAGLGVTQSAGVGPVNSSKDWPTAIKDNPILFQLTQSPWGEMYLLMLAPYLVGNVGIVCGQQLPTGWGY